jgi:hypothetical protein
MGKSHKPRFKLVVEDAETIHFHIESEARAAYERIDESVSAMIMIRSKKNWENYMGRDVGFGGTMIYEKHPFYVSDDEIYVSDDEIKALNSQSL